MFLDKRGPLKLGIIGGSFGFLTLLLPEILTSPNCDFSTPFCSPEPRSLPFALALPIFLSASLGIIGGFLSNSHVSAGATTLLAGAAALMTLPIWMVVRGAVFWGLFNDNTLSLVMSLVILFWWDGLLILAGLTAIPRVRSYLKHLHDAGWIP